MGRNHFFGHLPWPPCHPMTARQAGSMVLVGFGTALTTGGLLFAQPASSPLGGVRAPAVGVQRETGLALDSEPPVLGSADGNPINSLFFGLTLGLVVAFAGVGLPGTAYAAAAKPAAKKVSCAEFNYQVTPDVKQARACAKEKYQKWEGQQKKQDPKYAQTSTGAGRYRLYGLDKFSPIKSIPDWTDGSYRIGGGPDPKAQEEFRKKAAPFLNYNSKYGNFYSPGAPYSYAPK